ncbi:MAG: HD domain-containing protein [Desulfurococcales archaeon]|nr:HD domain-containing protein [Desulfurococcales archaeon]
MYRIITALSSLARTGWMLRGVPSTLAETVAEHLFASAVIALEAGYRLKDEGVEVDPHKAAAIALAHDMGEALIGDIAKVSGIDKTRVEEEAVARISGWVEQLYKEFEHGSSIEARIARASELAATILRARRYMTEGFKDVKEIEESSIKALDKVTAGDEKLRKIMMDLLEA